MLLTLEQARTKAQAVAAGHQGTLRIAPDRLCWAGSGLPALLALCREERQEVGVRLFETPLSQVVGGLGKRPVRRGLGDGQRDGVRGGRLVAVAKIPLVVVIPARHLLAHKRVPLDEGGALPAGSVSPHGL